MSRRQRNIVMASLFITAVFLLSAWFLWENDPTPQRYIPGEQVEGVTTRLDRRVPDDYRPVTFRDATRESGIDFSHFNHERTSQLAEDMGSGVAWFDYNNDGWEDLFLVNYAEPFTGEPVSDLAPGNRCKLYKNNGDGTFSDVSRQSGLDLAIRGMGAAPADFDNDGWTDLFVTAYGQNRLMKNNGDGTFSDITGRAGLSDSEQFWAGASWGDYNRDGHLDLYVTGYVDYEYLNLPADKLAAEEPPSINPSTFEPVGNRLYRNNGDGTFSDVSLQAGVTNEAGRSLSASWVDLNQDLWPDLYVANDVSDNVLYLNNADGTFTNVSHRAHVADYRGAMGLASGDWDNDGDADLFITHWLAQENALYTNRWRDTLQAGSGAGRTLRFTDDSANHGLGHSSLDFVGWATSFLDFDLDGRLDLYVVNGSTTQYPGNPERLKPMPDQLFWNAGRNRGFYDVSSQSGPYFSKKFVGRGGAVSDYDRDGDPDLFILNHNDQGILLQNSAARDRNWLAVTLEGTYSNRSAIGAHLRLVSGTMVQVRQVGSQSSYLSFNSLKQYFGLGTRQRVDTLSIRWPSGKTDTFHNLEPNQFLNITEGHPEISAVSLK
ncbi:CRTAC1 family protein [Halalkalibaculum sp. DA384]|uniref:CRTAC1 family protein n=1 Tax=Halalkalibaculum sp. DA384 TaxID=3373606 RepID=UPI003754CA51